MRNQYYICDSLGMSELPLQSDEYSAALATLRAGRDFIPGNPLALEYFHIKSFNPKIKKYIKAPAAMIFFNTPQLNKEGKIIATEKWPYGNGEEFSAYLKQTEYGYFIKEHWLRGDFNSRFTSSHDFQVIRFQFIKRAITGIDGSIQIKIKTVL